MTILGGHSTAVATLYHVSWASAPQLCMQLAGEGWQARWSDNKSQTHLRVEHETSQGTEVRRFIARLDPTFSPCRCATVRGAKRRASGRAV